MYYCKECGSEYSTDQAVICVKCGTPKGGGSKYCQNCAMPIDIDATVCMQCGVSVETAIKGEKSKLVAGLLGIFLGGFGIHNFYLGFTQKAVIQLVSTVVGWVLSCIGIGVFVSFGIAIWGFVEGILILCGKYDRDAEGKLLRE